MILKLFNKLLKSELFKVLIILMVVTLPYSNTVLNGFSGDDPDFIIKWEQIKAPVQYFQLLKGQVPEVHEGTYRPLRSLYYVAAQTVFGENPIYYHLLAIVIHAACTLLIYLLTKQLSKQGDISFFTSLLFAAHPIHTEAISFITTSFDIIGIFWGLLALYFYTKNERTILQYVFALCCFILAIFSYEITLTIPIILLFYHWLLDKKKLSFGLKALPLMSFFYFIIFYFFIRVNLLHIPSRGGYINNNLILSLQFSIKQIPIYLSEVFIPYHIGLDHFIPPDIHTYNLPQYLASSIDSIRINDFYGIFSLLLLILYLLLIVIIKKRSPMISFSLAFIIISLLPVLNLFPGYLIMFEKYLYLASFASCFILAVILRKISIKKIYGISLSWLILIPTLIIFTLITFRRNFDWESDIALWSSTVKQSPQNAMLWYQLGSSYQQKEEYSQAVTAYQKAISINDDMYFIHTNLGISYYLLQNLQQALIHLEIACSKYDKAKEANLYLGKIYLDYQDFGSASKHFMQALEIDPNYIEAKSALLDSYNKLGNLLAKSGKNQEAYQAYQKALALDPEYEPTQKNIKLLDSFLKQ